MEIHNRQHTLKQTLLSLIVIGLTANSHIVLANDSDELEELRAMVQELSQKMKMLERKSEIKEQASELKKKETPVLKASDKGFAIESADGKNVIKFRGLLQSDYRSFSSGANDVRLRSNNRAGNLDATGFHDANDTALVRRARPIIEGTLFGRYDFRFSPDFANGVVQIFDAYVDARFDPAFKIRIGKYKPFVGLERLQTGSDIKFVERSYVTNAILPNRDIGISLFGDFYKEKLSYAIGVNNGVVDAGNSGTGAEFDSNKEVTARVFANPFKDTTHVLSGLGFGLAATYTNIDGEKNLNFTDTSNADASRNGLPAYLTNSQQVFFRYGPATVAHGSRFRISPQAHYYYGAFGLIAEYAQVEQEVSLATAGGSLAAGGGGTTPSGIVANTNKKLSHDAWQVAASYLITGEEASFKGVKPKRDFDLDKGGWGAWELVARYSEMNLDRATFKNQAGQFAAQAGADLTGSTNQAYADGSKSAQSAHSWATGINWYLNSNAKIQLDYEYTTFDGGAAVNNSNTGPGNGSGSNIKDREDEKALLARFHVNF